MEKTLVLKCNKLYIGDPCFVLKGDEYERLTGDAYGNAAEGLGISMPNGEGDIPFEDEEGWWFNFESGQLAIIDASKCNLEMPENPSFFEQLYRDSLLVIDVPSGSASIEMNNDGDILTVKVTDTETDEELYYSDITSVEGKDDWIDEDEDEED